MKLTNTLAATWFAAMLCIVGGTAHARQRSIHRTANSVDEMFVKNAAEAGMTEVKAGEIAERRGTDDAVKHIGNRMVDDHSKANEELKSIAEKANIRVPDQITTAQKSEIDRYDKMLARAFDSNYVRTQRSAHLQAIKLFENEIKNGSNVDLKEFASRTLPTIREHYKMFREMKLDSRM